MTENRIVLTHVWVSPEIADGADDEQTAVFSELVGKKILSLTIFSKNSGWDIFMPTSFRGILSMLGGSKTNLEMLESITFAPDRGYYMIRQALSWKITNNTGATASYEIYIDVEEEL